MHRFSITRQLIRAALVSVATLLPLAWSAASSAADVTVDVQDLGGKPLLDAVVFAEPANGLPHPSAAARQATIDQVNKEFVPLVSVVQTGTRVSFPNSDNIRHSIYSFSPAKVFTTKLYSGKQASPVVFDKAGLVVLGCNIHDHMVAWVVVVDTPFFGKTTADGSTGIHGLEPGDYRLSVWYPTALFDPHVEAIHVAPDGTGRFEVKIDTTGSPLPAARVRASAEN